MYRTLALAAYGRITRSDFEVLSLKSHTEGSRRMIGRHGKDQASHRLSVMSMAKFGIKIVLCIALALGSTNRVSATTGMGMDIDLTGVRSTDLGPTAGGQFLKLCNVDLCISSSEEVGSRHYIAPWTYNDDGKTPVDQKEAMSELVQVLEEQPDFTIVEQGDDYMYAPMRVNDCIVTWMFHLILILMLQTLRG